MEASAISFPSVKPPSILDLVFSAFLALIIIPTTVCACLARRFFYPNPEVPLWQDALMSVIRSSGVLPFSVRRQLMSPPSIESVTHSPHFEPYADNLCERVKRPDFAGWWACKGAPGKPEHPRESDLVVIFLHGGAYVLGHPFNLLPQLLCAAERAATERTSVSLFALHYQRAPEATFPTQFDQCVAAYRYIIEELKVDPSRVVVMGESAGGHLALAFLHQVKILTLPKPGGAFLIFPWVDLSNSGTSFETNKYKDMLVKKDLDRATTYVLGLGGRKRFQHLVNLADPRESGYWKATLPEVTLVNVGTHDSFFSSILAFTEHAKADGVDVQLDVVPEAPHGYTAIPDVMDSKAYLKSAPGTYDKSLMKIASMYAKVFVRFANTLDGRHSKASK